MAQVSSTAWSRPLASKLVAALAVRRCSLASKAYGRVLDLGGWRDHLDWYRLNDSVESVTMIERFKDVRFSGNQGEPEGISCLNTSLEDLTDLDLEPFDSIVSIARIPGVADIDWMLSAICDQLAKGGSLFLLEPTRYHSRLGKTPLYRRFRVRSSGQHSSFDITAKIRRHGMVVTDVDRFEVSTIGLSKRHFVEAVCRWPAHPSANDNDLQLGLDYRN